MAEQKGLGSKFLGLFVEKEGGASQETSGEETPGTPDSAKSAADLVAELAGQGAHPKPGAPKAAAPGAPPPPAAPAHPAVPAYQPKPGEAPLQAASIDFDPIFKKAGIDPAELDNIKKALELLKGLPADVPQAMKRTIVETTLRTMGFPVEKLVQGANNQMRALGNHAKEHESATQQAIEMAQQNIRQLDEKIIELKVAIDKRTQSLTQVKMAVEARKAEVQKVLEFFQTPPAASEPPKP
ncbi:MAG: hypothetical protein QM723_15960 [Myxococcaceae bacterium]